MGLSDVTPTPYAYLRQELEATRQAYHVLLAEIPEEAWDQPTANPAWNVRQMMYHITLALRFLPADIAALRRGYSPPVPPWLFNRVNEWFTRFMGSRQSRASLADEYDRRHDEVMTLLATIEPHEWQLAGDYPDINRNLHGRQTIASMFHYITAHFREHAEDLRPMLEQDRQEEQASTSVAMSSAGNHPQHAPRGLSRILLRAPLFLYRLGLGPLLGGRFLLLHHVGRKSGLPRRALLEVTDHEPDSDTYFVASGFGRRSQWFQNVRANPLVRVQVGARRFKARAEILDPEASADKMVDYVRSHPATAAILVRVLGFDVDGSEEDYRQIARQHLPFVALHVQDVRREKPTIREITATAILLAGVIVVHVTLIRRLRARQTEHS